MKQIITGFVSLFILLASLELEAEQSRWSFDLRLGIDFPTQDLGDANLDNGFGFEATLAYQFIPHWAAYAGWGWNKFSADQSFAGSAVDFEETGYTFGLQFEQALGESALDYFIRFGGLYNHIEIENSNGNIIADSGHGLGWQLGAGLVIPLGKQWELTPDVRYRSLSTDFDIGSVKKDVDLTYFAVGLGVSRPF